MQRYEFVDGSSAKFWEVAVEGSTLTTRWGRIGTDGQTKAKDYESPDKAQLEAQKAAAKKAKKGYAEVASRPREPEAVSAPAIVAPSGTVAPAATQNVAALTVHWTKFALVSLPPFRGEAKAPKVKKVSDADLFAPALGQIGTWDWLDAAILHKVIEGKTEGEEMLRAEAYAATVCCRALSGAKRERAQRALVDRWVTRFSLATAVELCGLVRAGDGRENISTLYYADRLRHWAAAAADDASYQEAFAKLQPTYDATEEQHQGSFAGLGASAFPSVDNPLFEVAARTARGWTNELYSAVMNIEQLRYLQKHHDSRWDGEGGAWFAKVFGPEGHALFKETCSNSNEPDPFLPYQGVAAARDLLEWIGDKAKARRLSEYMVSYPEEALEVLPGFIDGAKSKEARTAGHLLLELVKASPASKTSKNESAPKKETKKSASAPSKSARTQTNTSTSEVTVAWTKDLEKKLPARRGISKAPRYKSVDPAKLFTPIRSTKFRGGVSVSAILKAEVEGDALLKIEAQAAVALLSRAKSGHTPLIKQVVGRWVEVYGLCSALQIVRHLNPEHGMRWAYFFGEQLRPWAAVATDDDFRAATKTANDILDVFDDTAKGDELAPVYVFILPQVDSPFFQRAAENFAATNVATRADYLYRSVMNIAQLELARKHDRSKWWSGDGGVWLAWAFGAEGYALYKKHSTHQEVEALLPYVGRAPAKDIAGFAGEKRTARLVSSYLLEHPTLAREVLPEVIAEGDKATARAAKHLLEQVDALSTEAKSPSTQSTKSSSKPSAKTTSTEGAASSATALLAEPPWRAKKRPWPFKGKVQVAMPATICAEGSGALPDDARIKATHFQALNIDLSKAPGVYHVNFSWIDKKKRKRALPPSDAVRVFGAEAIPGLIDLIPEHLKASDDSYQFGNAAWLYQWLDIGDVRFVPSLVTLFGRKKDLALAKEWAQKYPAHTVAGLGAMLFGGAKERELAHRVLQVLLTEFGEQTLLGLATDAGFGTQLKEWLALDPRQRCPKKAKQLPSFVVPSSLSLLTQSGDELEDDATQAVIEMVSFAKEWDYAGVQEVRSALDEASLDDLAKALALAWITAGSKSANGWVVDALGLYASDAVVPWVKRQVRQRLADKDKNGTLTILEQLIHIDSPSARLEVVRQLHHGRAAWLRRGIDELLTQELKLRGMLLAEYEEGAIPVIPAEVSLAGVSYRVRLDAAGTPILMDHDGKRLPRQPAKASDEEKGVWAEVKSDAGDLAKLWVAQFERWLIDGRDLVAKRFAAILAHPVGRALSERLIFEVGTTRFRIGEDGSPSDMDDNPWTLPRDASVSLAHPAEWTSAERGKWAAQLADYELTQPIVQVSREVGTALGDGGQWKDKSVHGGLFMGLTRRGWDLDVGPDGAEGARRTLPGVSDAVAVHIDLSTTLSFYESHAERPGLRSVTFGDGLSPRSKFELAYAVESVLARE